MTPQQARMARTDLGLSIRQLAAQAGLSPNTVLAFEGEKAVSEETRGKLHSFFQAHSYEFTTQPDGYGLFKRTGTWKPQI